MKQVQDAYYEALVSRDARFDGKFFVGVRTTGIYCRSVCPAPKPKRQNCTFYPSAAAAEDEGFRPCKRCRPETAPGSPAWAGTKSSVARGLKLIGEGAMVDGSVDQLADRLGLSARHVRRLFDEHLGTTPKGVARTQRLHLAKQLLEGSHLSMTDVALSAGYRSLRAFNHDIRQVYDTTPTSLRSAKNESTSGDGLSIRLGWRPPYDWRQIMSFLRLRAVGGVEICDGLSYRRTVRLDGRPATLFIEKGKGDFLIASIGATGTAPLLGVVEQIRMLFDLNADPTAIVGGLTEDKKLAPIVRKAKGLRVPGAWDPFELLIRAILGQQITVAAGRTIAGRLSALCGDPLPTPVGELTHLFPTAEQVAEADLSDLGMPRARIETLRSVARAVATGDIDLDGEPEDVRQNLSAIKGIGPWTIGYFAMRAQKDPDAFPKGDVALVQAAQKLGIAEDAKSLDTASHAWSPWRAYAALHLWNSLGDN